MSVTWILCLAALLAIPVLMIYIGFTRQKLCSCVGAKLDYDSALAVSSPEAWAYAQKHSVKRYKIAGCVTGVIAILLILLALDVHAVGTLAYTATLLLYELLVWGFLVISVESGLRKLLGIKES